MRSAHEGNPAPASSMAAVAVVSALLAFNLAVIGPHTVWAANANEYNVSIWSVLAYLVGIGVVLMGLIAAPLALVPAAQRHRAVVLVFSLSGLAWLQGNWLLGDFGLLDGAGLDLAGIAETRLRDGCMWVGGIAVAQVFARTLRRHVAALAGTFLALQLASLPFVDPWTGPDESTAPLSLVPPDEIFSFSRDKNFILVILDTITSDTFVQFADRDPEHFDRAFDGFTLYPDTTGAFPSTRYSLPVILGAPPYDNRISVDDYLGRALKRDSITGHLLENGIEVDWVAAWPLFCRRGRHSSCYAIPRPYGKPAVHHTQMAAELFDIALFRHAPADAKRWIYNAGAWRTQALLWREAEAPVFANSGASFYRDFNAKIRVGRAVPIFKIVHTGGGHGPFVLDADCASVPSQPNNTASYEHQVRCSLTQTEEFLQRLRQLGIYDAATIVVASDHGASFGAHGRGSHGLTPQRLARARPLLAVKWPGTGGGLSRSRAPASVQDIAPTLAAAAGLEVHFPGRDLATLAPDTERDRSYGLYVQRKGTPGGHLERVERYAVARDNLRPSAWRFDEAVFSPAIELETGFIDAGEPGAAPHFSYLGWGKPASKQARSLVASAVGPVATVFATLPPGAPVELRARLRVSPWALPQVMTVEANGVSIARWRVEDPGFREFTATIPSPAVDGQPTAISFHPANHQRQDAKETASAFDLDWIRFAPRENR